MFKKSSLFALVAAVIFCYSAASAQENYDMLRTEVAATVIAEMQSTPEAVDYETIRNVSVNAASSEVVIDSDLIAKVIGTLEASGYEMVRKGAPTATPAPITNTGTTFFGSYGTGYWYPTPTYYSYQARLIRQNQNYMHMPHDTEFTITWTIRNTGPLDWNTQFYLRYYKGQPSLDGTIYMLPYDVERGETISISRSFKAEMQPGIYNSYWELVDDDGVVILDNIWAGWQVDDWRQ